MPNSSRNTAERSTSPSMYRDILQLVSMAIFLSAFLFVSSCHVFSYDEQPSTSDATDNVRGSSVDSAAAMDKVDPEVSELIDRIEEADSATATSMPGSLSALSSSSLKVDDQGRIQVYVYVSAVDEATRELLSETGAEVELENRGLKVYQTWVPAAAVRSVAAIDGVEKITPPSYASHR